MDEKIRIPGTSSGDRRLLELLKKITGKGRNAEVKMDCEGHWVVYDVDKSKIVIR